MGIKETKFWSAARSAYHRVTRPARPEPTAEAAVLEALRLPPTAGPITPSPALAKLVDVEPSAIGSREIFTLDGRALPCWVESDLTPEDDWLTAPNYYPLYHALFEKLCPADRHTRLFEIGVRTGYVGTVFARAAKGSSFYLGLDPNLYVGQGLELAAETCRLLRQAIPQFEAALIEGYSWDLAAQHTVEHTGPFDLIHIDGDHSLRGKLIDLHLARRLVSPAGLVLVDDFNHIEIIADSIHRAMKLGWYKEFAYVPTKRGLGVLRGASL
jgi:predicted O-methyltransferase YrrM